MSNVKQFFKYDKTVIKWLWQSGIKQVNDELNVHIITKNKNSNSLFFDQMIAKL